MLLSEDALRVLEEVVQSNLLFMVWDSFTYEQEESTPATITEMCRINITVLRTNTPEVKNKALLTLMPLKVNL